jgi:hypothetical protein
MRLMKAQSTNLRSIRGNGVKYDTNDQVIMQSKKGLRLPKGRTSERPFYPENGYVRYNIETEQLEVYQDGQFREVRFKEPNQDPGIVQQNLGVGDEVETDFGPLNSGDANFPVPAAAQNVLVFVENVFQVATTNYDLVQNPAGKTPGWYIRFGTAVPFGKPVTVLHNFDK